MLLFGFLLFVTAIKGNTAAVFTQITTDLTGSGSTPGFLLWAGAILFLAVIGSILQIPRAAKMFIALVLIVYILKQQGLWAQASTAVSTASTPAPTSTTETGQATTALDTGSTTGAATPTPTASGGMSGLLSAGSSILKSVTGVSP